MADVPARFKVDLREVRGAFGEIRKLSGSLGSGALAGVQKGAAATNRELAASPGLLARMSTGLSRAAKGAAAIAAITTALVILNRRFPVIGQVAAQTFGALTKGGTAAVSTTAKLVATLGNLRVAIGLAAGIYTLAKAFRSLRTESANLPAPKLPGAGAGGIAGGGAFRGGFAGGLFGMMAGGLLRRAAAPVMAGLMAAGNFEQTQMSYEVLTGSLAQAESTLGQIRDMAAKTPFTLPGLADAGKTLLAFGITAEQVPGKLRMLGDIAGGNQEKLESAALVFGQISSAGRLMGQDLLQLVNLGFNPLQTISERTGESMVSLKKRMEDGAISAAEVEGAFVDATSAGGRFYQMTEKQSRTFLGLLSKLKDAMDANRRAFATPIMAALKPAIAALTEFFEKGESRAAAFGEAVAKGLDFIRAVFATMSAGEIFVGIGKVLQYGFQVAVDTLFRGISAAVALLKDADFMADVKNALEVAALRFKEIMLLAAAEIVKGFEGILPKAKVANAARYLTATADVAEAEREALQAGGGGASMSDLIERARGEFADAKGLFGNAKNDALFSEITGLFDKAAEMAAQFTAERIRTNKGLIPNRDEKDKDEKTAIERGTVQGAFQRAINLIQGRTVNEIIAAEAQKSNKNQEDSNKQQKEMDKKLAAIERNTRPKSKPVTVNVVPTFGNNIA